MTPWKIIDEKDEVLCDNLTQDEAERLMTRWSEAECWMTQGYDDAPRSEHYIPKEEA